MSAHHVVSGDCPLCEEKLNQAHPILIQWFTKIKIKFPEAHIAWTFRNQEDQERCFQEGLSKLRWPNSAHNHMKDGRPYSKAIDLFFLRSDNIAQFPYSFYKDIADFLKSCDSPLGWGGLYKTISDNDHYQLSVDFE